jgi:HK97 family phage prohead protease
MDDLCTRSFAVRALREDDRSIDVVASTDAVDRHDEVVEQVWQLDRYRANPVVLYAHASRELPIGQASGVEVEGNALRATLRFVTAEANPLAERVWQSLKQGSLRAVSVGFVPHSFRFEVIDDREVLVLSDNELVEISVVPVPANPDALASMRARALDARKPPAPRAPSQGDTMKSVLVALGLAESAHESDALAATTRLRESQREVLALTGKDSFAEALGVLHAWRAGAQQTETLAADVQSLRAQIEQRDRAGMIEQARRDGKLAPTLLAWAEAQPLDTLKSFLAAAPRVVPGTKAIEPAPPAAAPTAAAASKPWEQLTPMEKHALHASNPDLFSQLRAEWKLRTEGR